MSGRRIALLFDVDGTLIDSGGAGARSWKLAFDELYGIPADIGEFTDTGMTDPDVGRQTFEAVLDRKPSDEEFAKLLERREHYLHQTVAESEGYRVLPGAEELLRKLLVDGYLLGLVTGNLEASAHIKLHRAGLNRYFSFGGYGSDSPDRNEVTRVALRKAALVYGAPLEAQQAIVIGDTPHDVSSAHAAGIECVGVASHEFDVDQLRDAEADWVIESLAEGLPAASLDSATRGG
ncbi:MAG TPA: HAD family hydrolase [Gaiella sp.]|nr:HAD family hydrolase [Gaiella sp.]